MYENERANRTENSGGSPYFDYITYPTETGSQTSASTVQEKAKKPKKKPGGFRKAVFSAGLGLCFGLFAGAGFYAVKLGTDQLAQTNNQNAVLDNTSPIHTTVSPDAALTQASQVTYVANDVTDVVEAVMPAMVSIINNYTSTSTSIWGQTYTQPGSSSGTGIIVAESEKELLIVSNNHVVEGANELQVTFIDGSTAQASIKGLDPDMDLAVIAVALDSLSAETKDAIAIATLGDSDQLNLGEPVIAIGNALGYGQSVTTGIVSALNRELTMDDGTTGIFIQTDAAINPGNSGGALLNINGEVIGINSSKIGGTAIEGMGYAIPITSASPIIAELMEHQTRNKVSESEMGYMGITMQEIPDQIIAMYNMPQGVFVYDVEDGSAAQQAGIMKGDVIVRLDGFRITTIDDIQNAMQYYAAGDIATITVKRSVNGEYETLEKEITMGRRLTGK